MTGFIKILYHNPDWIDNEHNLIYSDFESAFMLTETNTKVVIDSGKPGKNLVVFCAVHGNEKVGVIAINNLLKGGMSLENGSVTFVLCNPEAYKQNVRALDKNFNRYFDRSTEKNTNEGQRLHELMDILDTADALLDIHAFNSPEGTPFILGSKEMKEFASAFPFEIFSYGWVELEPHDTCDYMYQQNKSALCLECGSVATPEKYLELTEKSIVIFLQYFGLIGGSLHVHNQKVVRVHTLGVKKTNEFHFVKDFKEFESLDTNVVFAYDGEEEYVAGEHDVIVFPRPNKPIGGEVFLLGTIEK